MQDFRITGDDGTGGIGCRMVGGGGGGGMVACYSV